jgi:DHA1 family inner membrane transport protein
MGNDQILSRERGSSGKGPLLSLALAGFVTVIPTILITLLLIDIGRTFGTPIGVTAQIQSVSSIVGIISALLLGALSVRYSHKSLLMVGLAFIAASALGCAFAQNFTMMLLLFPLSGLGLGMVIPMCSALVGALFPLDQRASALGAITAGMSLSYVIGPRTIVYIADSSGWRLAFLVYLLPALLVALLLTKKGLPAPAQISQPKRGSGRYWEGFKAVFSTRGAVVCLGGVTLSVVSYQVGGTFGASFLRDQFTMSSSAVTLIFTGVALASTVGSLVCGRFVNRFGRKSVTVVSVCLVAVFSIFFITVPHLMLSVAFFSLFGLFNGIRVPALQSLSLEQVPTFRGTMMAITIAAGNLGASLGAGVGGLLLLWYDWKILGVAIGGMGILAAFVFYRYIH